MADKVKWGVIGSGGIARRRTIPEGIVAAENSELVSVYDISPQANAEVAKEFNATACNSIEELLTTDIDAVYVATPANVHLEQVLASVEAGKHVLCEKPLAMNSAEVEQQMAACEKAGVLFGVGLMMRYNTQHQTALKMIQDGELGTLTYARAQLSNWYPPIKGAWRQDPAQGGGGSLMDLGGHCIDLISMFFGRVKKVCCYQNNLVHDYKSEDSSLVSLFFENGAMGSVDNFFCAPDSSCKNVIELYGSKGSIMADSTISQRPAGNMMAYLQPEDLGYAAKKSPDYSIGQEIKPEPINTYWSEINEFSDAILTGRKPSNSADLGLESQKILDACYESARIGQVVEIDW